MDREVITPLLPSVRFDFSDIHRSFHVPLSVLMSLFLEFYETQEFPMVPVTFDKGDTVLEAGAGIGFISTILGVCAGKVVSLEAIPEYFEMAGANLAMNAIENVTLISGALGVGEGEVTFQRRMIPYASSFMDEAWAHDIVESEITVAQFDINDLIREHGINALHLDLEGGEVMVLPAVDFGPINKVIMEFHPRVVGQAACQEIMDLFLRNGLEAALIGGPRNYPTHSYTAAFAREPFASEIRRKPMMGDTASAAFARMESA